MPPLPEPRNHIAVAIDVAIVGAARNGDSAGVPMSQAVGECDRAIWLGLRWASAPEAPDPERQRRFRIGHVYEDLLINDLRAAGATVETLDPATGKQFKVTLARGHVRGKLDGRAIGVPGAPVFEHVVEAKSHNKKSYDALVKGGGVKSKPDHHAQCQLYMHATGIQRCVYIAECKDDGRQHVERVAYDPTFAITREAQLERIVFAPRPPPRNEGFWCDWCNHRGVCLDKQFARVNCRTCIHSEPGDDASWRCVRFDRDLDYRAMQAGCPAHRFVPDLVPGEQVDVRGDDTVVYRLHDGSTWEDGEGAKAEQKESTMADPLEVVAYVELPDDSTPEQVAAAFAGLRSGDAPPAIPDPDTAVYRIEGREALFEMGRAIGDTGLGWIAQNDVPLTTADLDREEERIEAVKAACEAYRAALYAAVRLVGGEGAP